MRVVGNILRRVEPSLLRWYRRLAEPPAPNLKGDRDVEYSWLAAKMPEGPGVALDVGSGHSFLGLMAALKGFEVTAVDLTAVEWAYVHPLFRFERGDVFTTDVAPRSVDLVICCSTVEHFGLGRYGDRTHADGDLLGMKAFHGLLKEQGTVLLTVPLGIDSVFRPLHRVYGGHRLPLLLRGFAVEEECFWVKDDANRWTMTERADAMGRLPTSHVYGLGCFRLRLNRAADEDA